MKQHSKEYREAYGELMTTLAPVIGRAMALAPEAGPVYPDECENIQTAGNALLRELDAERKAEASNIRIVKDDDKD